MKKIICLILFLGMSLPLFADKDDPVIILVTGKVWKKSSGSSWEKVWAGDRLEDTIRIKTESASSLRILLEDGKVSSSPDFPYPR